MKTIIPIWFAKTASWWTGLFPTILAAIEFVFTTFGSDQGGPVAESIVYVLSAFGADISAEMISEVIRKLTPLYLLLFAYNRGTFTGQIPRPYVLTPTKEKQVAAVVENGLEAFKEGQKIGKLLK